MSARSAACGDGALPMVARAGAIALAVWLVSAVVLAQGHPAEEGLGDAPLSVETVGAEPTVVKTGDVFTATFRVRFKDLVDRGKEIVVLEDRMDPEKLSVAPFEAVGLEVRKRQVDDESMWDFVYRFRIVNPNRGIQVLGRVTFYWLLRDLGQKIEEAQVFQAETEPLQIRYVSTLTEEAVLDIRDAIELGSFGRRATLFRTVAWAVAPLPVVWWAVGFVLAARRRTQAVAPGPKTEDDLPEAAVPAPPSVVRARRNLRRHLRTLSDSSAAENDRELEELERRLVVSLREYLMVEVPSLNPGDTAREIKRHFDTRLDGGRRAEALKALAERLVAYQDDLERGTRTSLTDPAAEAREIGSLLQHLRPHVRAVDRLRRMLGRA
jgi:hypothetical protein